MQKLGNCAFMQTIDLDTLMQINYESALMQVMIIGFSQSAFMQDLIIVFSQNFDFDQNYIQMT